MIYLIGMGLKGEKSLTLESVDVLKKSDEIYLENYTGFLPELNLNNLKKMIKKKISILEREDLENNDNLIQKNKTISILFQGDPLSATTHHELILRAKEKKINFKIIHNASIITGVSESGLQLYNFGKIISIPFWTESFKPKSYLKNLENNLSNQQHTLCLLDLKPKKKEFLTIKTALNRLIESKKITENSKLIICSRLGTEKQKLVYNKINVLKKIEFKPPNCVIIPGRLHFLEKEFLNKL